MHLNRTLAVGLLVALTLGNTAAANELLSGTLALVGKGSYFLISTDGQSIKIDKTIPATFAIDSKPLVLAETFTLTADGKQFEFKIEKEDFSGKYNLFSQAGKSGQPVNLTTFSNMKLVKTYQEMGVSGCTYTGYCYGTHMGTDGKLTTSYGFQPNCSGTEDALWDVKIYRQQYTALLTPNAAGEAVAKFRATGPEKTTRTFIKSLSDCDAATGLKGIVGKVKEYPLDPADSDAPQVTSTKTKQTESPAHAEAVEKQNSPSAKVAK